MKRLKALALCSLPATVLMSAAHAHHEELSPSPVAHDIAHLLFIGALILMGGAVLYASARRLAKQRNRRNDSHAKHR